MSRRPALFVLPALAFSVACGASSEPIKIAPPTTTAPPVAQSAAPPTAPVAHAPAPPLPPGIDADSMDTSVAPCDDFYQYACGGWIKANPIPDDQSSWVRFNELSDRNELALRAILEGDAAKPGAEPYSKALGDFFTSCMDVQAVEKEGTRALDAELRRIDGVADARSLARALAPLHDAGVNAFFDFGSRQDFKDATQEIGILDQAGLGMPDRDYYLKDDEKMTAMRGKYVAHLERMLALLGEKPEAAKKHAQGILALEKQLAEASMPRVDRRVPENIYHKTDRKDLAKQAPTFPWDDYFAGVGAPKEMHAINVTVPPFFAAFDKIVASATKETWSDAIRPYLKWQLVHRYAPALPERFVDEGFAWDKELSGVTKNLPRWKRCVKAIDRRMGEALAIPFVKEKLGADGKQTTQEMIQQIEAAMQRDLEGIAWMDDETRPRALAKVHKLFNKIGYPDKWRNYDKLVIEKKSYAANVMRANVFESHRQIGKIGKPVERGDWLMSPPMVNAYYNAQLNEMVFPAGILQPPFYGKERPDGVNFGAIGMVMGHELTHGFDDAGRKFDGDGNMSEWWTPKVSQEFEQRAQCVVDQFNDYVAVDDLHVNGKLTLGENLADLGGMKLALAALHAKGKASPEDDRQFFLGAAQIWCGGRRPEQVRVLTRIDSHSPNKWRVVGPMSNLTEFAQAFSCQAGDAMVRPESKRCQVW
jgi:endothelin-converting enzyme/putative endopeptidase